MSTIEHGRLAGPDAAVRRRIGGAAAARSLALARGYLAVFVALALRTGRRSFIVASAIAVSAAPLVAQVAVGDITGVVRDQGGAAVPAATVTVTNLETNRRRVVVSNDDGVYSGPGLTPGHYRVDVEKSGF